MSVHAAVAKGQSEMWLSVRDDDSPASAQTQF